MNAAVWIAVLALAFAIGSFWWLNARRGSLEAAPPRSYGFVEGLRLRFPLVLFNTGARALIVSDLRLVVESERSEEPLTWATSRSTLRPESGDVLDFATPFAVQGRDTAELIAEFGDDDVNWKPDPGSRHRLRLDAQVHPSEEWTALVGFDWWAPPTAAVMSRYIAHRNEPPRGR